jgi:flagellar biosynthetic protein FliP
MSLAPAGILRCLLLAAVFTGAAVAPARAQDVLGPPLPAGRPAARAPGAADPASLAIDADSVSDPFNPAAILAGAARALPGGGAARDGRAGDSPDGGGLSTALNIVVLLTVITLVPSIMLMTTCFVRIIVVLGLLRQALGTQQLPPPQVILGLSLFMTLLVMAPTIDRVNTEAIAPFRAGLIRDYDTLWDRARQPVRDFMFDQIEATGNWSSVYMVLNYRGIDTSQPDRLTRADVDLVSLIPAFMLSELKVAFLMGFRVYLPFLVIDMVIASMLISMSMMMLPPPLISLPFKLLLFVLVDGWQLVVGSLMQSFVTHHGPPAAAAAAALAPALTG